MPRRQFAVFSAIIAGVVLQAKQVKAKAAAKATHIIKKKMSTRAAVAPAATATDVERGEEQETPVPVVPVVPVAGPSSNVV